MPFIEIYVWLPITRIAMIALVVENENQVDDMLKAVDAAGASEVKWISVSPFATERLEQLGIKSYMVDIFMPEKMCSQISEKVSFNYVIGVAEIEDSKLGCEHDLKPFSYWIYELFMVRSHLDYIYSAYKMIDKTLKPEQIWAHTSKNYLADDSSTITFDPREARWGRIFEADVRYKPEVKAEVKLLPEVPYPVKVKKKNSNKERMASVANVFTKMFRKKKSVLVVKPYAEWRYCYAEFMRKGCGVYFFDPASVKGEKFERNFTINDVDSDMWYGRVFWIADWYYKRCLPIYLEAKRKIEKLEPIAVLTSTKNPETFPVCKAARDLGVPVVTFQHGSAGYYRHKTVAYSDMWESDYYFTFGQKVADIYKGVAVRTGVKVVPVGMPSLDCYG